MPPNGRRCLDPPKHMGFFLELQAKHNQEIAEFQRMAQTGMADLRRKQEAELDAAIQQERTDKEQQHKHQADKEQQHRHQTDK